MARVSKNRSRFRRSTLNQRRGFSLNDFSFNSRTIVNTISQSGSKTKNLFHVKQREIVRPLPFKPVEFVSTSAICRARKVRRQVLFAKGKNGGKYKPPTYTLKSLIRCN